MAWNKAATQLLTDYGKLPVSERNLLRQIFLNPHAREAQTDWESVAYHMVSVFRADVARAGAIMAVQELVDQLISASPEFTAMWQSNEVDSAGEGIKQLLHPQLGQLQLEY